MDLVLLKKVKRRRRIVKRRDEGFYWNLKQHGTVAKEGET